MDPVLSYLKQQQPIGKKKPVCVLPVRAREVKLLLNVCFAMTINKSKGQSLSMAGIGLREECFSHGQFYVACFRVTFARATPGGKAIIKNIFISYTY
ncbi:ATP-dependent DNA helicase PIF1-like [Aphis craccivora]|uniref:ATP-dependent DNA helicase PIF1-like n=1 Tax=Aphis craccivora TaxID=307492 RepID=A0A6G0YRB2_APHCR|nr:ATP-dependent DNA helicase PIF1-like [Aphis craccivora]